MTLYKTMADCATPKQILCVNAPMEISAEVNKVLTQACNFNGMRRKKVKTKILGVDSTSRESGYKHATSTLSNDR